MSGAIPVDTTAGGVPIINTDQSTRLVVIANTGAQPCALKLDLSATVLTFANGHPLAAGEKMLIGLQPGPYGPDVPMVIKAIASGAGATTVVAQTCPE